ncbi:Dimer-Tnp-hAT dimerization containing protein [Pyrenophora tritici-repentis]|uniref:Dimer-Tnp-hAT dimerization containing protein n=1 Tax=Pyrenophora tritici-repentis TaxID=45151 RepID=A0A922NLX9_9PLEO|nr:Dimer-Tnp-hAT dimerization containing protein [Pyrenophora tritici-repentis]
MTNQINQSDQSGLIVAESEYIRDSDKKEVYYCHECRVGKSKQELFVINGTSRIRNHLEQKHQIDPQSGIKRKGSVRKSIIDQQKDGAASSIFFWKESVEKFKELLIRWIVYCHIAFFQLENQYFRELLLFLNPALLNHLPKAAKTIRSWVMNAFISKKQQLREDLHHSRSRISISFDLWTSPNPYAILGVVAMWIDTTGMRRVTALGMRRIYGEHTGENLGSVVLELLEEYDISGDQIGYFMLDNASANDTAVEFILKDLCPSYLNRGNFINNFIEPAGLTENEEDEYEAWKRSEPIAGEGVDPIKYWVELRDRHPSLSKFAIDMLSIPGSSCECERLFSELGDLLEPRRRSISPQLLAAIQCDRRWIRAGFGSGEVPVKGVISDEEMDAKYGVHKWDIS